MRSMSERFHFHRRYLTHGDSPCRLPHFDVPRLLEQEEDDLHRKRNRRQQHPIHLQTLLQ